MHPEAEELPEDAKSKTRGKVGAGTDAVTAAAVVGRVGPTAVLPMRPPIGRVPNPAVNKAVNLDRRTALPGLFRPLMSVIRQASVCVRIDTVFPISVETVQPISSFGVFSIEPSAVGSDWCGSVGDRPARLAIAFAAANSFHCETRWSALLFSLRGLSNLMQCFIIILAEATSGYQKMVAFMEKCLPADEVEEASKPNNEWCCLRRRH